MEHILLFSILAILSGATSYRKVQAFIDNHYQTLDEMFDLKWKGKPAYTTIRDIILRTSAPDLEASFRQYSALLAEDDDARQFIAFDGKVLRGSFDHFADQKAVQILSAFVTDSRIILAHAEIATKTNEIPTAQDLMRKLGLSGCIFTFDALHCQEKTLQTAQETGNEVIVQVKGNQKTLFNDCQTIAETMPPDAVYSEPFTKSRNRIESRTVEVYLSPTLTATDKWEAVAALVTVDRYPVPNELGRYRRVFDTKTKSWKSSDETAFTSPRLS